MGMALHRTRYGLRTFAIGSNNLGAQPRAGINVDATSSWCTDIRFPRPGWPAMMVTANFAAATPSPGKTTN